MKLPIVTFHWLFKPLTRVLTRGRQLWSEILRTRWWKYGNQSSLNWFYKGFLYRRYLQTEEPLLTTQMNIQHTFTTLWCSNRVCCLFIIQAIYTDYNLNCINTNATTVLELQFISFWFRQTTHQQCKERAKNSVIEELTLLNNLPKRLLVYDVPFSNVVKPW